MKVAERIVCQRFRIEKKIGSGSFGQMYSGEDLENKRKVALKVESTHIKVPQLAYEAKIYSYLDGGICIPKVYYYGSDPINHVLAMQLLGKSLEDLLHMLRRPFSLKTVLMLAIQMISCVEYVHLKTFIHRDIKPSNFVMGRGNKANQVFIIDFGLTKRFIDPSLGTHIPYAEKRAMTGTARYASIGTHQGHEQSRRDDLESLGYVWLYLLRGSLPWMSLNNECDMTCDQILSLKNSIHIGELCQGLPVEFIEYFEIIRNMSYEETPKYSLFREMFRNSLIREGYVYDYMFDWLDIPKKLTHNIQVTPSAENSPAKVTNAFSKKKTKSLFTETNLSDISSQTVLKLDRKKICSHQPKFGCIKQHKA